MKLKHLIFILSISLTIVNCDSLSKENFDVAENIIETIDAESGKLVFQKYLTKKNPDEKYYIELTVNNCAIIDTGEADPKAIASFCAHQLYEKLDKTTIKRNFGYEIKFKGKIDSSYFFKKSDVKHASFGIKTVSQYYELMRKGNLEDAMDLLSFEESHTELEITTEISSKIKALKEFPIHFFSDYTDEEENDSWLILSYLNLNEEDYITTKSLIKKTDPNQITYIEVE